MLLLILINFLFFRFASITMSKAGNFCVIRTPLLVIFDVYVIRFMGITTAQVHSTRSGLSLGALSNPAGGVLDFYDSGNL